MYVNRWGVLLFSLVIASSGCGDGSGSDSDEMLRPTRTPTNLPDPPTPVRDGAALSIDRINGVAGDVEELTVRLFTRGNSVAETENVLRLDSPLQIVAERDGRPRCTVNPAIDKDDAEFAVAPVGCDVTRNCTGIRAIVYSNFNVREIPDGSELYTCSLQIPAGTASGDYQVTCGSRTAIAPDGSGVSLSCSVGDVVVR